MFQRELLYVIKHPLTMVKKKLWLNSLILLWYLVPSPMKISEIQMPTHVGDAVEALVGMFAAALA